MKIITPKRIAIIITIAASAAAFIYYRSAEKTEPVSTEESRTAPTAVRAVRPDIRTMEISVSYLGSAAARKEVKVIARVPGRVTELPVREGDRAAGGSVLARIDTPEIRAGVERLTAERDYWLRRHEADKRLVEKEALASEQAEASERSVKTTTAALAEAAAQLEKSEEKAPFSGTVLSWQVEPGQSVMPGQPLLLYGGNEMEIRVDVVEEDLRRGVKPGTIAELYSESGETVRSRVSEISHMSSGNSRSFLVKIPLPEGRMPPPRKGSSLRVNFILETQESALTVPASAVAGRNGEPHIFLVRDGMAKLQIVETGIERDGRLAVSFPWNGTDPVVITNIGGLRDGTPLYAVEVEEALK